MPSDLAVLAFSGGMDSTVMAAFYSRTGHDLMLLSFQYDQRHARELQAAGQIAAHYGAQHHLIDVSGLGALLPGSALTDPDVAVPDGHYADESMRVTVVPGRNAIMANIAAGIASAHRAQVVALGIHAGDHAVYPDCRPEFLDALRACVSTGLDGLATPDVQAPFIHRTKTQIAQMGVELAAPLHLSWSCYRGQDRHCGTCGTCVERREAFAQAGIPDPTVYAA